MKIVTLYSFKGGAGRTVCTANLIPLLAKKMGATNKTPMLVIDMDIDSAGLTHILEQYPKFEDSDWVSTNFIIKGGSEIYLYNKKYERVFFNEDYYMPNEVNNKNELIASSASIMRDWGIPSRVVELFKDINIRKSVLEGFHKMMLRESTVGTKKKIIDELSTADDQRRLLKKIAYLLPAYGMVDISDHFVETEGGSIKFIGLKQGITDKIVLGDVQSKLTELILKCENANFCGIVIDSASGNQAIANAIHRIDNNILVYCMRLTKQFRDGTRLRLLDFINKAKPEKDAHCDSNVILLPIAVPTVSYKGNPYLSKLQAFAEYDIKRMCKIISEEASGKNAKVKIHDDFVAMGIPEVESFKWQEEILYMVPNRSTDQEEALKRYAAVAEKIKCI